MPPPPEHDGRPSLEDRYRALLETGRTLTATLSPEELYAVIHRETAGVMEAQSFHVCLYDPGRDLASVAYHSDDTDGSEPMSYRGSDFEVVKSQKAALLGERLPDAALLALSKGSQPSRSGVVAPMVHHGRVVGVICALSERESAYTPEDLHLFQGIADIAAVAIDNAIQFSEIQQRRREAEQVEEIGRALTSELDAKAVLGKVADAAVEVLDLDGAAVWLFESTDGAVGRIADARGDVLLPVGLTWNLNEDLQEALIRDRKSVVIDDLATSTQIPDHLKEHLQAGSAVGVPILVGGHVAGVLAAGSKRPRRFGAGETAVLQRLASQCSVALENARLHANLRALTLTDPLTGLPNRRRMQLHLDKEVGAAIRGRTLSVAMFDIDRFKMHNDTHGHVAGDDILRSFADILQTMNRAKNVVARYGGDEFVSVLADQDSEGTAAYVERVIELVQEDEVMSRFDVSVSPGWAQFDPDSMESIEDILEAADFDMYSRKAARRKDKS